VWLTRCLDNMETCHRRKSMQAFRVVLLKYPIVFFSGIAKMSRRLAAAVSCM